MYLSVSVSLSVSVLSLSLSVYIYTVGQAAWIACATKYMYLSLSLYIYVCVYRRSSSVDCMCGELMQNGFLSVTYSCDFSSGNPVEWKVMSTCTGGHSVTGFSRIVSCGRGRGSEPNLSQHRKNTS